MEQKVNGIKLFIRSREGVLFDGNVSSLSSTNEIGKFDVLPNHSNFISLIRDHIDYTDLVTGVSHKIPITRAILKASGNEVSVYIGM